MKRQLIIILLLLLLITGCTKKVSVKEATTTYLNNYINLNKNIVEQLNNQANRYYKNELIRDKYIDVLKRQYRNLEYSLIKEKYDGEFAYAYIEVKVYDLYDAQKQSSINMDSFVLEDGSFDNDEYNLYKLDMMLTTDKKVSNTIIIKLLREDEQWEVLQLNNENLEKIHGIYNYES